MLLMSFNPQLFQRISSNSFLSSIHYNRLTSIPLPKSIRSSFSSLAPKNPVLNNPSSFKRNFSSNSSSNGWGSYPGISSSFPKYSKDYKQPQKIDTPSSNPPPPPSNNYSSPRFSNTEYYRKILEQGDLREINNNVLLKIENSDSNLDIETIEIYLQALLLTNVSSENAAVRLANLLRNYPLIANNLRLSQLINNFYSNLSPTSNNRQPNKFNQNEYQNYNSQDVNPSSNKSHNSVKDNKNSGFNNNSSFNQDQSDGTDAKPIHVVVTEEKKSLALKTARWLIGTLIYAFCILTFLNLAMEGSGVMQTAHSPKVFVPEEKTKVTFGDVQGCDEAKIELQELVEFLKDPKEFSQLGGKLPRGVLLTGPPGTGKTLLARAVAGEADVPFFFMSGAEFDEIYVGVGSKRLRELFAAAREKSPSIVFIDEIDAIGSKRSQRDQSYMKQTLNQLLVELDGFSQSEGVIFIGATNFPESLDSALTRPGRFDRVIDVPLPDVRGRISILKLHTNKIPLSEDVDLSVTARGTVGFSGAELNNLVNIAAIQASKDRATKVSNKHLEYAKDKILMGAERKSAYITPDSRVSTAYHEGGHALVALYTKGALPLHKATIMPRGHALGVTVQLPEMDKNSYTRQEYLAMLDVCMGGYVAEQLVFGYDNVTSGSSSDLSKATSLATSM
ncbi:ATP-dependent zinc metalloprotease YME1-like protein, partial [Smittium culicis]